MLTSLESCSLVTEFPGFVYRVSVCKEDGFMSAWPCIQTHHLVGDMKITVWESGNNCVDSHNSNKSKWE